METQDWKLFKKIYFIKYEKMIDFYNAEIKNTCTKNISYDIDDFINTDSKKSAGQRQQKAIVPAPAQMDE